MPADLRYAKRGVVDEVVRQHEFAILESVGAGLVRVEVEGGLGVTVLIWVAAEHVQCSGEGLVLLVRQPVNKMAGERREDSIKRRHAPFLAASTECRDRL